MTNINIDDEAMQAIVSRAIVEGISTEQKLSLVDQAIKYLITAPESGGYGRREPTPLQQAFNQAVRKVSESVVAEVIQDEQLDTAIREGINKALSTSLEHDSEWLYRTISDAIATRVFDRIKEVR